MAALRAGSLASSNMAAASSVAEWVATSNPFTPGSMGSRHPMASVEIIARPVAMASSTTLLVPSRYEGNTNVVHDCRCGRTSSTSSSASKQPCCAQCAMSARVKLLGLSSHAQISVQRMAGLRARTILHACANSATPLSFSGRLIIRKCVCVGTGCGAKYSRSTPDPAMMCTRAVGTLVNTPSAVSSSRSI